VGARNQTQHVLLLRYKQVCVRVCDATVGECKNGWDKDNACLREPFAGVCECDITRLLASFFVFILLRIFWFLLDFLHCTKHVIVGLRRFNLKKRKVFPTAASMKMFEPLKNNKSLNHHVEHSVRYV